MLTWLSHSCAQVDLEIRWLESPLTTLPFPTLLHFNHHLLVFKVFEGESRKDRLLRNYVEIFRVAQGKLLMNAFGRNDASQL